MNEKRRLKNRSNISTAIKTELLEGLKELSHESKVAMSRLLDESIDDLLIKHKKKPPTD